MPVKLVYLLWSSQKDRGAIRDLLLGEVARELVEAGARQLTMNIADPESEMRSPAPRLTREQLISAQVSVWLDDPGQRTALEERLSARGFRLAGYRVEEWVYTDYGDNRHASRRDWPDGRRSPGVMLVHLLERPRRLTLEEWMRRWHGLMSPVSEAIQPRSRYVRNLVVETLTADAPRLQAIVEEAWPSKRHVTNPFLFYGAGNPLELVLNLGRILRAVLSFLELSRIRVNPTGEYFVKTDPGVPRLRRSSYDRYL